MAVQKALPDPLKAEEPERQPPAELAQSTVSEIAGWLVGQPLHTVERELIKQTLEACDGDRALAASLLDITLPQLRKKLTAYAVRGQPLPGAETNSNAKREEKTEAPEIEAPAGEPEPAVEAVPEPEAPEMIAGEEPVAIQAAVEEPAQEQPAPEAPVAAEPEPEQTRPTAEIHVLRLPTAEVGGGFHVPAIEAPEQVDFSFGDEPAQRCVTPEPTLAVPPPANDVAQQALAAPAKRAPLGWRLPVAAALTALLIAPIAYGLLKDAPAVTTPTALDRAQLEVSVREQPMPLEQRIAVPAWVMPERAASAAPAAVETPAPAPAAVAAPVQAVFAPDTSADVAMDLGPANTHADVAMALAPPNAERDVAMALTPIDTAKDAAMVLTPPNPERDVAMTLGPVDIAVDTRMEPGDWQASLAAAEGAPETTGSISETTFFKAPQRVPMPVARLDPEQRPVARPAPAPRQAARPAQAEENPLGQGFFPFNLFAPQPGTRGAGTGNPVFPAN